jgi:16S rRNA (adenine1518-N6/adenine1519-N6)-dimethyltransferase
MVKPKKHLGQHFLTDLSVCGRMAEEMMGLPAGHGVLEVGPGTGALTKPLLSLDIDLHVIETDSDSARYLVANEVLPSERVHEADFLKWAPSAIEEWAGKPFAVVGNFPYNISSQILFWVLDQRDRVPLVIGMFQKEVAERVVAPEGSRVYGILSVLVQTYFEASYLFTVPPHVFVPPPKVQSGVIRLQAREGLATEELPEFALLKRVVKGAFNQRRKTLRNALRSAGLPIEKLPAELADRWLPMRAEQLSPAEFQALTKSLFPR